MNIKNRWRGSWSDSLYRSRAQPPTYTVTNSAGMEVRKWRQGHGELNYFNPSWLAFQPHVDMFPLRHQKQQTEKRACILILNIVNLGPEELHDPCLWLWNDDKRCHLWPGDDLRNLSLTLPSKARIVNTYLKPKQLLSEHCCNEVK